MDAVLMLTASGPDWWGEQSNANRADHVDMNSTAAEGFPNAPVVALVHGYCKAEIAAKMLRKMAEEIELHAAMFPGGPELHQGGPI